MESLFSSENTISSTVLWAKSCILGAPYSFQLEMFKLWVSISLTMATGVFQQRMERG